MVVVVEEMGCLGRSKLWVRLPDFDLFNSRADICQTGEWGVTANSLSN